MDENNKWMMLLLFSFHQTERQWRAFETEIKYNNRYFPKSQILGFDGIRFYSSLNPPGKNIVLFNTKRNPTTKSKDYEIVESKVYSITKLDLNYQIIAPIEK